MESCYVPNNPNFASVDQWTPPSPTSPPSEATSSKQQQQRSLRTQQQQQQQQQEAAAVFHDPGSVLQHLCSESDVASSAGANSSVVASSVASSAASSAASSVDSSSHLTSLSALPPVQVHFFAPFWHDPEPILNRSRRDPDIFQPPYQTSCTSFPILPRSKSIRMEREPDGSWVPEGSCRSCRDPLRIP